MEESNRSATWAVAMGMGGTALTALLLLLPSGAGFDRVGYIAILSVPLALAVGGLARRPVLFAPAAMLAIGVSPMLWSGMPLLLVPGGLYTWAYLKAPRHDGWPRPRAAAAVVVPVVVTIAAMWSLSGGSTTEHCASSSTSTSMTSSCTTAAVSGRVAAAIALAIAAVILGYALAPRIPKRCAHRMTTEQIAVGLPEELLARLDELVGRGVYETRAAAVRAGIEAISEIERQRELDEATIAGYRQVPPTAAESDAAVASLRASILEEPW